MILHTLSIDLETLEIEYNSSEEEDGYFETEGFCGETYTDGQVTYNEDGWERIYCEASSKELAHRKVLEYCLKMSYAFNAAAQEISNVQ